jgi:hypothetical protein
MTSDYSAQVRSLLEEQKSVISRAQAIASGVPEQYVDNRVRSGMWVPIHRGVYATVTGNLDREAELRAALLRAGTDAILSHWSAAELHRLIDRPWPTIHVTVPEHRNPARHGRIDGVVIHRSDVIMRGKHPSRSLPCTRVDSTIADLIECAPTFDAAYEWICKGIGRRLTTAERILTALELRQRVRWDKEVKVALTVATGALSWLELRYVRGVEIPHCLPTASRQAHIHQDTGNKYLDNLYEGYLACVELDGAIAHPEDEQQRDKQRDRWNLVHEGTVTMRFGVPDLVTDEKLCETAAQVAKVLNDRGPATGRRCPRIGCPVGSLG